VVAGRPGAGFPSLLDARAQQRVERRLREARIGRFKPMADFEWTWPKQIHRPRVDRVSLANSELPFVLGIRRFLRPWHDTVVQFSSFPLPTTAWRLALPADCALSENLIELHLEYDHTFCHTHEVSTTERVTITLSADLVEGIDRVERNRSRFISEAIEHELARRRREQLLSSIQNPHPETADSTDTGLGDWSADLPDDEGLVDRQRGTAVRWVEGQGWVKEPA
jgi:hypothetical protein